MTVDDPPANGQNVAAVHQRLRDAILRGELPGGRVAPQLELARELDVGRTPLREALRLLQHEGLVVLQPNRRVQITPFTVIDAEELYMMRIALEAVAVRVTVPRFGPADIAELEGLMAQMDHLAGAAASYVVTPHRAFHARFVAGAGTRFAQLIAELADQAERYRRVYGGSVTERWPQRQAEHRLIVDAAKAGDAASVAEAIARHYLGTARIVAASLDPAYPLSRLTAAFEAAIGTPAPPPGTPPGPGPAGDGIEEGWYATAATRAKARVGSASGTHHRPAGVPGA